MILPVKSWKTAWFLYWLDLEEPVPSGGDFILPTLLIVGNEKGAPLAPPEILEEIDQTKVEEVLAKLIEKFGIPDRLVVDASEEWDEESWKAFSEDYRMEILFQPFLRRKSSVLSALAKSVAARLDSISRPSIPQDVSRGLLNAAFRARSTSKKIALLKKAIERDPDCSLARVELGDAEFQLGNWKESLLHYEEVVEREFVRWQKEDKIEWWANLETRPYLRAIFGKGMTLWHQNDYASAAQGLSYLLKLNPTDNQGVRFLIPLLWMLAEEYQKASAFYESYAKKYKNDSAEPAFLFVWGLVLNQQGHENEAREKYLEGILKNLYIAPLLLELPEPPHQIWHPHNRAEPSYAKEFIDYYACLWDRDAGALRVLRETWMENAERINHLIQLRSAMAAFQDQRYDPEYQTKWKKLLDEDADFVGF